jgi:sec-independent protein translocase protein TatA
MANYVLSEVNMPGPWEWIIIFIAVLIIFGAKRLPEIARAIGKSIKEFRKATKDIKESIEEPPDTEKNREKKDSE